MKYSIVASAILLLLVGCDQPTVTDKDNTKVHVAKQTYMPPPPKKQIKLKKIDDTNFNADYMYPEDKKRTIDKSPLQTAIVSEDIMDKEQCIAMITQEKFDKYASMFGSEAASIKRCKMLKATR